MATLFGSPRSFPDRGDCNLNHFRSRNQRSFWTRFPLNEADFGETVAAYVSRYQ